MGYNGPREEQALVVGEHDHTQADQGEQHTQRHHGTRANKIRRRFIAFRPGHTPEGKHCRRRTADASPSASRRSYAPRNFRQ